ncbi:hypothetical protein IWX90DRAFT_417189 [Phyllosticta citrichinensis]|uniref:Uncharacterized protein n=1 Tax=Phyllosticta citrichinensis TaxID=1130410 RepID=A0ABR1XK82_9PEZI
MSAYNTFALVQQFAEAMRCASPLSSSLDVPVTSRPKVWRNDKRPTMAASSSIDRLCTQIEERLDLGTECQETSECSSPVMTSDLTFEERCRKFDDLVFWVKDYQRRHAEKEPFIGAHGKLVGETAKKPRYKLDGKFHSKLFATAVENSGEESTTTEPTVKRSPVFKKSPAVKKRTPAEKVFPPKNFTPAKRFSPTKKAPPAKVTPIKKMASATRTNGEKHGVKVRDFAIFDYAAKKKTIPTAKSTPVKKSTSVSRTKGAKGEVKVRDFAYVNTHDKTSTPPFAKRARRDAFSKAG